MPERTTSERHVIVGTDFSPASEDAVERAIRIAREHRARLHIVHASGRRLAAALSRRFHVDRHRVDTQLAAVVQRARASKVRATPHHIETTATKALQGLARELGADVVVVGTRGRTVPDSFVGSTAERVAASCRVPVLLVRRPGNVAYREVVIAADHRPKLDASIRGGRFVSPDTELSVLHAYEGPFESMLRVHGVGTEDLALYRADARRQARAQLVPLLERAGLEREMLVLRHGDARRVLHAVPRTSLLVMERGSVVARALLGSVTRSVIAYGGSDVLMT